MVFDWIGTLTGWRRTAFLLLVLGAATPVALVGYTEADAAENEELTLERLRGQINDGVYHNPAFDMTLPLGEDWYIASEEDLARIMQMGSELLAGGDEALQAILDANEEHTVPLFALFKHPLGTPVPMNANMNAAAEYIGHLSGVTSPDDYCLHDGSKTLAFRRNLQVLS